RSKAAEKTVALQDASARSYALETAPAFGLRLSFWRFLFSYNPYTQHSANHRSKAAENTAALQDASASYYALEPAPAFGLRMSFLSFWRFLFPTTLRNQTAH